jgi:hypothetical protein
MADLVMRKRPAMHAGELGLFIDTQVFEDEFAAIKQGTDVTVTATQSRNIKQMRLAWGLCRKIADSGALGDSDTRDTMNYLLKKAKHVKYIANTHRDGVEVEVIVKSIRFASMEQTAFDRLFNRMLFIVTSEIIPDMPDGELRAEVEKMAGVTTPEPEKPKQRRRRRTAEEIATAAERRQLPSAVSIIPDHDPETGEVIEIPAAEPVNAGDIPNRPGTPAPEGPPPEVQATNPQVPNPATEPVTPPTVPSPTSAEPAPPPAAPPAAQAPLTGPRTRDFIGWRDYCIQWLEQYRADPHATDQDVMVKWNAERTMRNDCGVTSAERQPVSEIYLTIVEEKRKQGKPL